jgi:serine/threonine-protein kinase
MGRVIDESYRIVRLIGRGGMGSVYEAIEAATGRRVAVKVIRDLAESRRPEALLARFRREARAAMAIDSPHVAKVLATGLDHETGAPFIVMEYLEGEDLDQLFLRAAQLPLDLALRVVGQACLALQAAHAAGVVHRDVKPANVFLAREGTEIVVKVLDFGIARMDTGAGRESAGLTRTGSMIGSPLYMSPEQARGLKDIDHRSDLWSLGVLLHRALTGRCPHEGTDALGDLIIAICTLPVPPIREVMPSIPPRVAAIVHRALEREPEARFASAGEMLDALRQILPGGFDIDEVMLPDDGPRSEGRAPAEKTLTAPGRPSAPEGADPHAATVPEASLTDPRATGEPTDPSSGPPEITGDGPPPSGRPSFAEDQLLAGRYRIVRFISRGAGGEVYEAEDLELRVRVALKSIRASIARDPDALARFKREILLARSISHPNVCRIFDLGQHRDGGGGAFFLTMELLDGETLADRIERRGRLPEAEALPLVRQMAAALGAAHDAGVVHRDFKPGNVVIVPSRDGERAVVADFGLALATATPGDARDAARLTAEGKIVGTPAYVAPEQVNGEPITPRTDVYALGLVMYEMVTGQLAFGGETLLSVVARRLAEPPPPPASIVPDLDRRWEAVILRCLERAPAARFASAADVVAALDAPSAPPPRPPPSRPAPPPPRSRLPSRWWIGALAAIVALGAAAAVRFSSSGDPAPPAGSPRRLTSAPGWEAEPAISPDGKLVAYVSDETGNADIWVVDVRGGVPRRLTDDPAQDRAPVWFPDSGAIAFASERGGEERIWKVPVTGGPAAPIVAGIDPAISPDGERIAFVRPDARGRYLVWAAPLADPGQARAITTDQDGLWENRHPVWSPDGATVAYQDHQNIWIVPAAGGPARRVTSGNDRDSWPAFSSDGRHLYFSSMREGTIALWRLSTREGRLVRLTLGTGPEVEPRASRDGARLAYSTYAEERSLVVADPATGARARMPDVGVFALSPDGGEIVYAGDRGGRYGLWAQPLDRLSARGDPRLLAELTGTLACPAFSPDGRWIAAHRVVDGRRDLWIVPAAGGAPEKITSDLGTHIEPVWSPDGSTLAYLSDRSGKDQVWTIPVAAGRAAGEPRQITSDDTEKNVPTWSPRGDEIAYVAGTARGNELAVVSAAGGAPRLVTSGARVTWAHWDRATGAIYASGLWDGPLMTLRRLSPSTGEARPLDPDVSFGNVAVGLFDVAQDGKTVALREEIARGDIWVLDAPNGSRY